MGQRRLELFVEDHNLRQGWVTVGNSLSASNFNAEVSFKGRGFSYTVREEGGGVF